MKKSFLSFFTIGVIVLMICSCGSGSSSSSHSGMDTTDKGLEYKIFTSNEGEKPNIDDFISIHMAYTDSKDSTIFSSFKRKKPLEFKLTSSLFRGALNDGFQMLAIGDSALFRVKAEQLYGTKMPSYAKPGDYISYTIKLINIKSKEAYQKELEEKRGKSSPSDPEQFKKDVALMNKYISDNNLKVDRQGSGLAIMITKEGSGPKIKIGDKATVHYSGFLLDGTPFDSSIERNKPFTVEVGVGRVIKGWDEGLTHFSKGSKGKLIIPSGLGYGGRAAGKIPPNSVLVFDIELMNIQ